MFYSQGEVNLIFRHIPSQTLRTWAVEKLHQWASQTETGRGISKEYNRLHVYQIGVVEVLARSNVPNFRIKEVMSHLFSGEKYQKDDLALLNFVSEKYLIDATNYHHGSKFFHSAIIDKNDLNRKIDEFDSVIVINLNNVRKRVDNYIDEFKKRK